MSLHKGSNNKVNFYVLALQTRVIHSIATTLMTHFKPDQSKSLYMTS